VTGGGPLVAVLDYGIGNLRSAQKALQKVGADAHLTADPDLVARASGVVLPGVGAFGRCMESLAESGLTEIARAAAADAASGAGRPFLGVCVGMQMLFDGSDESPDEGGLGVLGGRIRRLPEGVKRPQMQWNVLDWTRPSALADAHPDPAWVYFVHSYWAEVADPADVVATCDHGGPITAAVERGALWATQFHPEKSAANGLRLLAAFVERCRTGQPALRG
jgi:imidazole glycerol-phosphate synthase subunit HisH